MRWAHRSGSIRAAARSCASCRASTMRSTRNGSPTRRGTSSMGLKTQRLDRPYRACRRLGSGLRAGRRLSPRSPARSRRHRRPGSARSSAILATVEEMFALKSLFAKLGSPNIDCRQDGSKLHPKFGRASYLFNSTIAGVDQADAILVIGSNPRHEAAVLNARIRKRWLGGGALTGLVGRKGRPDLSIQLPRRGPESLAAVRRPSAGEQDQADVHSWRRRFRQARWRRRTREPRQGCARRLGVVKDGWNGFNVLHTRRIARRRPRSRPCAGRRRTGRASDGESECARRALQPWRRRDRH